MGYSRLKAAKSVDFNDNYAPFDVRMFAWVFMTCIKQPNFRFLDDRAMYIACLAAHETANFTSNVFLKDNNIGGIKFINNPKVQKNATQGIKSPEGNYYAHFATRNAGLADLIRIVGKAVEVGGTTKTALLRFAENLKKQGYYTAPVDQYAAGLLRAYTRYDKPLTAYLNIKDQELAGKQPTAADKNLAQQAAEKITQTYAQNQPIDLSNISSLFTTRNLLMFAGGVLIYKLLSR